MENNEIDTVKFNLMQSISLSIAYVRQAYLEEHGPDSVCETEFIEKIRVIEGKQENWVNQWYNKNK